jgi:hypothetical protein
LLQHCTEASSVDAEKTALQAEYAVINRGTRIAPAFPQAAVSNGMHEACSPAPAPEPASEPAQQRPQASETGAIHHSFLQDALKLQQKKTSAKRSKKVPQLPSMSILHIGTCLRNIQQRYYLKGWAPKTDLGTLKRTWTTLQFVTSISIA